MFASSLLPRLLPRWPPRRPRAAALRGLACGVVLAAGLSTLAGGGAVGPADAGSPAAAAVAPTGRVSIAEAVVAAVIAPPATPIATPATGANERVVKPAGRDGGGAREPPPYAPGGDDLLNVGEPTSGASPQSRLLRARAEPTSTSEPAPGVHAAMAAPAANWAAGHAAAGGMPNLMLWLDRTRVAPGEHVVLHVAAIGATTCAGTGALHGLHNVGTRVVVRPTAPGRHRLGVSCVGERGRVERAVTLVVPLPVLPSSVENQRQIDFEPARLPSVRQLGNPTPLEVLETDNTESLQAVGDFFQEGRLAVFVTGGGVTGGASGGAFDAAAGAFFLARDDSGLWVDRTAELLPNPAERSTCSGPSQALMADFNLDGKPDVYVACQGEPGATASPAGPPGPCCRQVLFLSQFDGRYRRVETAFAIQAPLAEAADVDGDGLVDVVTIDVSAGTPRPLLWLGRGDGTFLPGSAHLLPAWARQAAAAAPPLQGRR